ncbi:stalk domain-containing protein [Paenibacillus wynnii]|uniref:Copper amine oxidase-like N-terminal domain-containing protein n=1 Tax=Paenibacillus wynnii TaxID=268407 RepID=A0A098M342_9BACL|nr:stalk domain-containing protein [Paenibacillus wynnii]KGE16403.1 hypothetical protein PWYN_16815 [Paenibacillus wynnii]
MKKWAIFWGTFLSLVCALNVSAAGTEATNATASSITSFGPNHLIKNDGSLWLWGGLRSVPTQVPGLTDVQASYNSLAGLLVTRKDLSVWKLDTHSTTLMMTATSVDELNNVTGIFPVGNRTIAVNAEGAVFSSVLSSDGTSSAFTPITGIDNVAAVDWYTESNKQGYWERFLFLKKDGTVWTSHDKLATFEPVANLTDVIQLQKNYVLKKDGTVWSWPIQSIYSSEKVVASDASVVIPSPTSTLSNILSIKYNGYSAVAIDEQSRLWFWGSTITGWSDGKTYNEQEAPILLTGIIDVKEAFVVERSIIVLTQDGKVYETSIERETLPSNAKFIPIASGISIIKGGGRHVIMQKNDGTLWGWGINYHAELGYGDSEFSLEGLVPVQRPISVSLNGESVAFTNGVITRNGQNFIPLRSLFEKMGALITFKQDVTTVPNPAKPGTMMNKVDKKISIVRSDANKTALTISINAVTGETAVNNEAVNLPTLPFIVNGTMYLPLRFISEKLGATVEWLPQEELISITMK